MVTSLIANEIEILFVLYQESFQVTKLFNCDDHVVKKLSDFSISNNCQYNTADIFNGFLLP